MVTPKKKQSNKKVKEELETEELPIVDAISIFKMDGPNANSWTCIRFKIQGDKVISVEAGEPDAKAIAVDDFKINSVKLFGL